MSSTSFPTWIADRFLLFHHQLHHCLVQSDQLADAVTDTVVVTVAVAPEQLEVFPGPVSVHRPVIVAVLITVLAGTVTVVICPEQGWVVVTTDVTVRIGESSVTVTVRMTVGPCCVTVVVAAGPPLVTVRTTVDTTVDVGPAMVE
jgi:hypothetical protein